MTPRRNAGTFENQPCARSRFRLPTGAKPGNRERSNEDSEVDPAERRTKSKDENFLIL